MGNSVLKLQRLSALCIVLFLAMPFISPVASSIVEATHTHVCHIDEHKDDCAGTKGCCTICHNLQRAKDRLVYYGTPNKLYSLSAPSLSFFAEVLESGQVPYISLVSLKVRLNN